MRIPRARLPGSAGRDGRRAWMVGAAAGAVLWLVVFVTSGATAQAEETPDAPTSDALTSDALTSEASTVPPATAGSGESEIERGRSLFEVHCSACHGSDGAGVANRGPDIRDEGAAAADFVLRTGRMPMADPGHQAQRGPVRFTDSEIEALVAFVGSLGDGPAIPDVDTSDADLANGARIFQINCAACHVSSGSGANIGGPYEAPNLHEATATQVAEAIIVGPGPMPVFADLTPEEINDVAAYVEELQRRDVTDLESLGGIGPVAEGLAAWMVAIAVLIGITRWIGSSHRARRRGLAEGEGG